MLEKLKQEVCRANLELVDRGVVIYTWGNVSGIDRENGLVVIKPSGVDYDGMSPDDITDAAASFPHANGPWFFTTMPGTAIGSILRSFIVSTITLPVFSS